MSKHNRARVEFHEPPLIAFSEISANSPGAQLLDAYLVAARRADAYIANPKFQRLAGFFRRCTGLALSANADYCFARADALQLRAFAEAIDVGIGMGADRFLAFLIAEDIQATWGMINDNTFEPSDRFAFLLDFEHGERSSRYAQSHVETLNEAIVDLESHLPEEAAVIAQAVALRWIDLFSASDFPLLNSYPDDEVLAAAVNPDFTPNDLRAQAETRMAALGPLEERARAQTARWRSLMNRVESTVQRIWEDYDLLEPDPTEKQSSNVYWILALAKKHIKARMAGDMGGNDYSQMPDLLERFMTFDLFTGEWFWFILLYQILAQTGGIDQGRLASWTYPLLDGLLRHPGRLMRLPVERPGEKARTQLSRHIAPMLRGSESAEAQEFLDLAAAQQARDERYVLAVARQIVRRMLLRAQRKMHANEPPLDQEGIDAIRNLWRVHFIPNARRIADYLSRCSRLAPPEEAAPPGPAESADPTPDFPTENDLLDLPEAEVVELPPAREHHWHWSRRPSDPATRAAPLSWSSDDSHDAFEERFLDVVSNSASMEIASLRHALEYFDSMTPLQRAMIPREPIGDRDWHKIKRGKHRILIREEDGRRLFHVYDRKDWVSRGRIR